jgi:hypothetical protein
MARFWLGLLGGAGRLPPASGLHPLGQRGVGARPLSLHQPPDAPELGTVTRATEAGIRAVPGQRHAAPQAAANLAAHVAPLPVRSFSIATRWR